MKLLISHDLINLRNNYILRPTLLSVSRQAGWYLFLIHGYEHKLYLRIFSKCNLRVVQVVISAMFNEREKERERETRLESPSPHFPRQFCSFSPEP